MSSVAVPGLRTDVSVKVCKICRAPRLADDFHSRSDGQRRAECRSCRSQLRKLRSTPEERAKNCARSKAYRKANPEKVRATKRAYDEKHRVRLTAKYRLRLTGWTSEAFERAWSAQDGKCAVCSVELVNVWQKPNTACADHDHETRRTRGILCGHCNRAIGLFDDDPERLRKAAAYVERYR